MSETNLINPHICNKTSNQIAQFPSIIVLNNNNHNNHK